MYCLAGRRVRNALPRLLRAATPDPYAPDSPDYHRRHRETVTTLENGTVRVDLGDPMGHRPPAEPPRSVPQATATTAAPPGLLSEPTAVTPKASPSVRRKDHRAITRNP